MIFRTRTNACNRSDFHSCQSDRRSRTQAMDILEVHSQLHPVGEQPWVAKQDDERNYRDNDNDKPAPAHTIASAGES